jgi:hypothetical protein
MKRFTLWSIMMAALWAGAAHAADASLCKSMCGTEKRECRANVRELAEEDGKPVIDMPERNPLARAAQTEIPRESARALDNAGNQARRMDKAGQCDAAYLRCTRACAAREDSILVKPKQDR